MHKSTGSSLILNVYCFSSTLRASFEQLKTRKFFVICSPPPTLCICDGTLSEKSYLWSATNILTEIKHTPWETQIEKERERERKRDPVLLERAGDECIVTVCERETNTLAEKKSGLRNGAKLPAAVFFFMPLCWYVWMCVCSLVAVVVLVYVSASLFGLCVSVLCRWEWGCK